MILKAIRLQPRMVPHAHPTLEANFQNNNIQVVVEFETEEVSFAYSEIVPEHILEYMRSLIPKARVCLKKRVEVSEDTGH